MASTRQLSCNPSCPKRIELDTLLDLNLEVEQDVAKDRIVGDNFHNPVTDDMDEFEKLVSSRCPTTSHRYTQIMTQQKALQTRTSKTDNYVRCWPHHCIYGYERKMKDKHELITQHEKA